MHQQVPEVLVPPPGYHRGIRDGSLGEPLEFRVSVSDAAECLLVGLSEAERQVSEVRVEGCTEDVPRSGSPLIGVALWVEGFRGKLRFPCGDRSSVGQAEQAG